MINSLNWWKANIVPPRIHFVCHWASLALTSTKITTFLNAVKMQTDRHVDGITYRILILQFILKYRYIPRNTYWRGMLSTIDLLIKVGYFVNKEKYSFSVTGIWSELVCTRRSTVLILSLQIGFLKMLMNDFDDRNSSVGATTISRAAFSIMTVRHVWNS